jgi:arginine deiminase
MMTTGKNSFSAHIYIVWEHPGMMKSRQKSKQRRRALVTNSGKSDARYVTIPLPKMLFTRK